MPRPVTLSPQDPQWAVRAEALIADLRAAAPEAFTALHHIGSTAVPALAAKPVIDLLGEAEGLAAIDAARPALEALGWRWRGENGAAGRRYFTLDDRETGARAAHLHVHTAGDPMIAWHLAFRDRLRAEPETAAAYGREKARCAARHPPMRRARRPRRIGWRGRRCGADHDPSPIGWRRLACEPTTGGPKGRMRVGWLKRRSRPRTVDPHP